MNLIPVAGTGGYRAEWVNPGSPWGRMMTAAGHTSVRVGGRVYRWDGDLDGIDGDNSTWEAFADALFFYSRDLPFIDRNYVLHSHAGNIGLILAQSGFQIRSMTTVGTPIRRELDFAKAEDNIGFHQHIFDEQFDLMGMLGSWRLGHLFDLCRARSMPDPRVKNISVKGISHSKILNEPQHVTKWVTEGWFANMVNAPNTPPVGLAGA